MVVGRETITYIYIYIYLQRLTLAFVFFFFSSSRNVYLSRTIGIMDLCVFSVFVLAAVRVGALLRVRFSTGLPTPTTTVVQQRPTLPWTAPYHRSRRPELPHPIANSRGIMRFSSILVIHRPRWNRPTTTGCTVSVHANRKFPPILGSEYWKKKN